MGLLVNQHYRSLYHAFMERQTRKSKSQCEDLPLPSECTKPSVQATAEKANFTPAAQPPSITVDGSATPVIPANLETQAKSNQPRSPKDLAGFLVSSLSEQELLRLQWTARNPICHYKSQTSGKTRVSRCIRTRFWHIDMSRAIEEAGRNRGIL